MSRKRDAALFPATKKVRPLTPKQELFVAEFLVDLNATQAAIRAGYSRKGASTRGELLLRNIEISAALAVVTRQKLAKVGVTAARVLEELQCVAFSDVRDLFDANGKMRPLHTLSPEQSAAIMSGEIIIKNAEAGDGHQDKVLKVRYWDKLKALELLCRHLRLLEPEGQPAVVLQQLVIRIQEVPAGAQVPLSCRRP